MISEKDYDMLMKSMKHGTNIQMLYLNILLQKYKNFSDEDPELFNKVFQNIITNENLMESNYGGALLIELAKIKNEKIQSKIKEQIGEDYDKLLEFMKNNENNEGKISNFLLELIENNNYLTLKFFLTNVFFEDIFFDSLPSVLAKNLSRNIFDDQYIDILKSITKGNDNINNILNILFNILHEHPEDKEKINILIDQLVPKLTDRYLQYNNSTINVIYKLLSFENEKLNTELSKALDDKYDYFLNAFKKHKEKQEDFSTLFYEEIKNNMNLVKKFYSQLELIIIEDFLIKYPIDQYFYVKPFNSNDEFLSEDEKRFLSIQKLLPYNINIQYSRFIDFFEMDETNDYQKFIEHFPIKEFAPLYKNIFLKEIDNLSTKERFFCNSFNKLPYELQRMYSEEFAKNFIEPIKKKYALHFQNTPKDILQQVFVRGHKTDNMMNFKYDKPMSYFHRADKPGNYAGIWASPKNPNTAFISLWDEYAQHKKMRNYSLVSTFKVTEQAKCLYLENYTDLAKLFFLYPKSDIAYIDSIFHAYSFAEGKTDFMYHTFPDINWSKVLEDYDVIYFAHKPNLNNTRINRDFYNTEQILIKDIKLLTNIQTFEIDEYRQLFCTPLQSDYKYDIEFFDYYPDYYEEYGWQEHIEETTHTSSHTTTHTSGSHEFNTSDEER